MGFKCNVCGNDENNIKLSVREMQIGTKEFFDYEICSKCSCLQIEQIPEDLDKYYPKDYYSFGTATNKFKNVIKLYRNNYLLYGKPLIGKWFKLLFGENVAINALSHIKAVEKNKKILDIGCGGGQLLFDLESMGYSNLTGIDPFIQKDINRNNVKIIKGEIFNITEKFDIIMLHHVFEHMNEPTRVLKKLHEIMHNDSICIIRTPIMGKYAWKKYAENWVQIDAPRHLFIHSEKSMQYLCQKVGLEISNLIYDSTGFQFWASEQYLQDKPLISTNYRPSPDIFSKSKLREFTDKARELNDKNDGDQAIYYLKKNSL